MKLFPNFTCHLWSRRLKPPTYSHWQTVWAKMVRSFVLAIRTTFCVTKQYLTLLLKCHYHLQKCLLGIENRTDCKMNVWVTIYRYVTSVTYLYFAKWRCYLAVGGVRWLFVWTLVRPRSKHMVNRTNYQTTKRIGWHLTHYTQQHVPQTAHCRW